MDALTGTRRRRRWSAQQRLAIVRESFAPGQSVATVARRHGVSSSQLFRWRKRYRDGSLSPSESGQRVVPASALTDALRQVRKLQRLLGRTIAENEMLREAVEYGRADKWAGCAPLPPEDD
ncbi:transposase [Paraburkholderia monticola]|uniref:Transposase n=1 Tax=Paraburkholderia monticola TaxID=1399968 RepID=A0A149PR12_9BURK|nr:transposase [Paraburkholderia monticola]